MLKHMQIFAAAALLLGLAACQDNPVTPETFIPEPETALTSTIAAPVDTFPGPADAAIYYHRGEDPETQALDDAEPLLETLLENNLALENAWVPILSSVEVECGASNVYPALVVQLEAPDDRILEYGFVQNPAEVTPPFYPNCGIEEFDHYAF